ncbi:hypothetical protein [Nocardia sp. NPDC051981]|uniref:hypothetical protein n=1 Tax=Nocardia sp. NPDC051981 TaxID=3155417 RepID=UPI00342167D0
MVDTVGDPGVLERAAHDFRGGASVVGSSPASPSLSPTGRFCSARSKSLPAGAKVAVLPIAFPSSFVDRGR